MNPATQFMIMDILENILNRAEHPDQLAAYLAEQMRYLLGGKTVVIFQCADNGPPNILAIYPSRHNTLIDEKSLDVLCHKYSDLNETKILYKKDLEDLGIKWCENMAIQPLRPQLHNFGFLTVFDLYDANHPRMADIFCELKKITPIISLVLKTGLQFTKLEKIIEERTQEIIEKEHQFLTIAENIHLGIFKLDKHGNCIYINDYWTNITHYDKKMAFGMSWVDHIYPDDTPYVTKIFKNYLENKETLYDVTYRLLSKENRPLWIHVLCHPEYNKDKTEIVGHIGTFLDQTEQKQIEEELKLLLEERKKKEELRQRHQKLESLGILAGGIAHDFNNLLTGIFGFIELAQLSCRNDGPNTALTYLAQTEEAFRRAKKLTEQLLTFSKGGSPIMTKSSIKPLIEHSIYYLFNHTNITLHLNFDDNLWDCLIDEGQIVQMIDHLLINAKESMPSGGNLIIKAYNAKAIKAMQDLDCVCLQIEDEGMGIDSIHLSHIFDPFYTTKAQGGGLGLSIVYSIIKKHGGHIEVTSTLSQGTCFTIYLPKASPEQQLRAMTMETSTSSLSPEQQKEKKVLILDDEQTLRDLYCAYFDLLGYESVAASTSDEALILYKKSLESKHPFTIVLLDLTLPGGDGGKELIPKLRELSPKIFAIATSGNSQDQVMIDPKSFLFDEALQKPFRSLELQDILKKIP